MDFIIYQILNIVGSCNGSNTRSSNFYTYGGGVDVIYLFHVLILYNGLQIDFFSFIINMCQHIRCVKVDSNLSARVISKNNFKQFN